MVQRRFRILGRVINQRTRRGAIHLRIEAWDKDPFYSDLVSEAVTDDQGAFGMEFGDYYFNENSLDRHPDLFFKVFHENKLIKTTEDSVLWDAQAGESEITIEVDIPAVDDPTPGDAARLPVSVFAPSVPTGRLIRTAIRFNHRKAYRLIGRDLYSVPINKPLDQQEYVLDKPDVIDASQTGLVWRVVVRNGEVCLES